MPYSVYVTRRIPQAGLEMLRRDCPNVEVNPEDRALAPDELLEAVRDRDGVLSMLTGKIDDAVLAAAGPRCRVFANMAAENLLAAMKGERPPNLVNTDVLNTRTRTEN